MAKLDDFNERLDRLERSGTDAPAPVSARVDQLTERLGRIERSVPAASAPPQAPAAASSVTPSPRPVQASAPPPNPQASAKPQAPAEPKKIADWTVREVIDGVAILQGRRGVIEVSVGDVVPGAGASNRLPAKVAAGSLPRTPGSSQGKRSPACRPKWGLARDVLGDAHPSDRRRPHPRDGRVSRRVSAGWRSRLRRVSLEGPADPLPTMRGS